MNKTKPDGTVVMSVYDKPDPSVVAPEYDVISEGGRVCKSAPNAVERYSHHGAMVAVRSALKGRHREHCLCWICGRLDPEKQEDNCKIANVLFALDQLCSVTTPVWECHNFIEKP